MEDFEECDEADMRQLDLNSHKTELSEVLIKTLLKDGFRTAVLEYEEIDKEYFIKGACQGFEEGSISGQFEGLIE